MGIFYSSAEMDSLLEQGQVTIPADGDARKAIYEQAQQLWAEDVPTIPIGQGKLIVVTQANVTGVLLDPTMFLHYFLLAK
jgi:peptide/nickel transport system substrate-binding protein